jgi:Ca-activated chloride channel family protein
VTWEDWRWLVVAGGLVVVLALAYALDFTRRRHLVERIGDAPQLSRMMDSVSPGKRIAKAVLLVAGLALIAVSLAGPRLRGERIWRDRGIDVVIAIDFSKSMTSRDVYPTRIDRARRAADAILDRLAGDRAAIVAFAGGTSHYPLTSDYEAARTLYHGLDPRDMWPGSDVGGAVLAARCLLVGEVEDPDCQRIRGSGQHGARRLEQSDLGDRARAIVLFTDGEDTEGQARAEVARAKQRGIEVYVVGIGTKAGGRIPELGPDGEQAGWKMAPDGSDFLMTRLDEDALKELAKAAGGEDHYFKDDPRRFGMDPLSKALENLKEGDIEKRLDEDIPRETYQVLLFPGFMLLLIEACLSDRRKRQARQVRA